MKKRDFILIFGIIVVAGIVWLVSSFFMNGMGETLKITVDNQKYGIYNLETDQVIKISDKNICRIENRSVVMEYADCPDQVCVHSSAISQNGQTIICMPNRVVLEIINGENQADIDVLVK